MEGVLANRQLEAPHKTVLILRNLGHNGILVKDAFDKQRHEQSINLRGPAVVNAKIAITALDPAHDQAYLSTSCYNHFARAIRRGEVHDDDHIILLGL